MDLMNAIALQSMSMKAAEVQQAYSTRLAKEVMDMGEELALKEIVDMTPQAPQVPKGQYLDVYA